MNARLLQPQSDAQWLVARGLVEAYAASLEIDLAFQGFARELERLPIEYSGVHGAFFLAEDAGRYVGCVGVRRFAAQTAEMKRLYVGPPARQRGMGRLLAHQAIESARALGYQRMLLDTLPTMHGALALYESLGFRRIGAYRFNPIPGAVYMELVLR